MAQTYQMSFRVKRGGSVHRPVWDPVKQSLYLKFKGELEFEGGGGGLSEESSVRKGSWKGKFIKETAHHRGFLEGGEKGKLGAGVKEPGGVLLRPWRVINRKICRLNRAVHEESEK